jgi:hypothetical protein
MKVSTWWPVPATVLTRGGAAEPTVALQAGPPTDEIPDDMRVPVRDLW